MPAMTDGDERIITNPSYPYLVSEMSRTRLIEVMESLHFNSRGECKVTLDEGVRDFLVRAIKPPR
jgi:hypothetical protein